MRSLADDAPTRQDARPDRAGARSLTPGHWVEGATELLIEQGVDGVRIDVLAKRLGVTRGSFYWHFRDRDHLLDAMLMAWRDAATDQVVERFDQRHDSADALMRELITLPFRGRAAERAARTELAVRAWALRDESARRALAQVDERRVAYFAQGFTALGVPILEARLRGHALYAWQVGESMLGDQDAAQRTHRAALLAAVLLPRPASQPAGAAGAAGNGVAVSASSAGAA